MFRAKNIFSTVLDIFGFYQFSLEKYQKSEKLSS